MHTEDFSQDRLDHALERAVLAQNWNDMRQLLDVGANVHHRDGWLMRQAIQAERTDIIKFLLARGSDRMASDFICALAHKTGNPDIISLFQAGNRSIRRMAA